MMLMELGAVNEHKSRGNLIFLSDVSTQIVEGKWFFK
jgi:hypothetical protein